MSSNRWQNLEVRSPRRWAFLLRQPFLQTGSWPTLVAASPIFNPGEKHLESLYRSQKPGSSILWLIILDLRCRKDKGYPKKVTVLSERKPSTNLSETTPALCLKKLVGSWNFRICYLGVKINVDPRMMVNKLWFSSTKTQWFWVCWYVVHVVPMFSWWWYLAETVKQCCQISNEKLQHHSIEYGQDMRVLKMKLEAIIQNQGGRIQRNIATWKVKVSPVLLHSFRVAGFKPSKSINQVEPLKTYWTRWKNKGLFAKAMAGYTHILACK